MSGLGKLEGRCIHNNTSGYVPPSPWKILIGPIIVDIQSSETPSLDYLQFQRGWLPPRRGWQRRGQVRYSVAQQSFGWTGVSCIALTI
jgi:hypothetical protein